MFARIFAMFARVVRTLSVVLCLISQQIFGLTIERTLAIKINAVFTGVQ